MSPLPEGWQKVTINEVANFLTGFPFSSSGFVPSGIKLVRGSNVKRGKLDWSLDLARYWPRQEPSLRRLALAAEDIVIAMDGALVGRSYARISKRDLPAYLVQRVARLRGVSIDQGLIYAWIGSDMFVAHVDSVKTHTAIPHISPGDIRDFILEVPISRDEQREIAQVLEDVGNLVAFLERLIAKKEAIRQGMMQELLTARTRLPGFDEQWTKSYLGEILTVRHGRSQKGIEIRGGKYPILASGGEIGRTNTPLHPGPSVLIGRKGTINRPLFQEAPFWTVDTLFYTEISMSADPQFLYYLFCTIDWRSMSEGSGVPSLNASSIESVTCSLPSISEQKAISSVLESADREVALLRTCLYKARMVRKGMTQELLLGRARLPAQKAVTA